MVQMMDIHVGKPLLPTRLHPAPDSRGISHTVIKVSVMGAKEDWVIDTTGCQYGFPDALVPFNKYMSEKGCRITREPATYSAIETTDLDYFATLPFLNRSKAQREGRERERRARLHFAAFVEKHAEKDILDGSQDDFEANVSSFTNDLKAHMLGWETRG